jgi:hypothetical protein
MPKLVYTAFKVDQEVLDQAAELRPTGVAPSAFVRYAFTLGLWLLSQPHTKAAPQPPTPSRRATLRSLRVRRAA